MTIKRNDKGQIIAGSGSLNREGAKKRLPQNLIKMMRGHTEEAVVLIIETMRDVEVDAKTRLRAAEIVLDRGWGKAPQRVEVEQIDNRRPEEYTMQELLDIAEGRGDTAH